MGGPTRSPVRRLHSCALPSALAVSTRCWSELRARRVTANPWLSCRKGPPTASSHRRAVPSTLTVVVPADADPIEPLDLR